MSVVSQFSTIPLYLICGAIILFVALFCVLSIVRAYRAGVKIGIDKSKLRRTITSSVTFTILPSISILLGVIALSGTLGIPLPWLRLSVVGALHYETSVADIAARGIGLSGLNASEMNPTAFVTIALVMTAGIIWGMIATILFCKKYLTKLQKKPKAGRSFGDTAMNAMFIGLICAYLGSYIGTYTSTGDYMPLIVMPVAALAMGAFTYFSEKKKLIWLDNFSIAGSMLAGMAMAVLCGLWL